MLRNDGFRIPKTHLRRSLIVVPDPSQSALCPAIGSTRFRQRGSFVEIGSAKSARTSGFERAKTDANRSGKQAACKNNIEGIRAVPQIPGSVLSEARKLETFDLAATILLLRRLSA
jgi:hypothetical protein